jgi:GntR family transcriptional regulator
MPAAAAPLYMRIQEMMRSHIASGQFAAGQRLPSETELAERFETTRTTVRQALAQLTFEGLITRRIGLGTFVATRPVESRIDAGAVRSFEEQMEDSGAHVTFRLLAFDVEPASATTAAALELPVKTPIYRMRRLRLVEREAIGLEDRAMPVRIGSAVAASALATRPATRIVESVLGTPLGGMTVSVGAIGATTEAARELAIRRGNPVLVRTHTFFDQNGRPVLTGESIYRGDKYRFSYGYGRVAERAPAR